MTLQEIADVSGVAVGTVHGAVSELFKNEKLDQPAKIVGKDGKAYPTTYKPRQAHGLSRVRAWGDRICERFADSTKHRATNFNEC